MGRGVTERAGGRPGGPRAQVRARPVEPQGLPLQRPPGPACLGVNGRPCTWCPGVVPTCTRACALACACPRAACAQASAPGPRRALPSPIQKGPHEPRRPVDTPGQHWPPSGSSGAECAAPVGAGGGGHGLPPAETGVTPGPTSPLEADAQGRPSLCGEGQFSLLARSGDAQALPGRVGPVESWRRRSQRRSPPTPDFLGPLAFSESQSPAVPAFARTHTGPHHPRGPR